MTYGFPISIVGGGLAGLALGIGLRAREVPAQLWETGRYPRHRVCGEVVRGRGTELLQCSHLLGPDFSGAGRLACSAAFYHSRKHVRQALNPPALCISRHELDQRLADRFRELGGDLRDGQRWVGTGCGEGVVWTSGRSRFGPHQGWRWFGLKAHASAVELEADVEIHLLSSGYVGLCRLDDSRVNICGLFRQPDKNRETDPRTWRERLAGERGSELFRRLANARWVDESFCSVAGLGLRPQRTPLGQCRLGDALTMISPITGNGMSMALEAADTAADPLARYSQGEISWAETERQIGRLCDTQFAPRLRWSWLFHNALFTQAGRSAFFGFGRWPSIWRLLLRMTS